MLKHQWWLRWHSCSLSTKQYPIVLVYIQYVLPHSVAYVWPLSASYPRTQQHQILTHIILIFSNFLLPSSLKNPDLKRLMTGWSWIAKRVNFGICPSLYFPLKSPDSRIYYLVACRFHHSNFFELPDASGDHIHVPSLYFWYIGKYSFSTRSRFSILYWGDFFFFFFVGVNILLYAQFHSVLPLWWVQ